MEKELNIGELAGDTMQFIMQKTDYLPVGKDCVKVYLGILTLCISEVIKASYCPSHYSQALENCYDQIMQDFDNVEDN
jgi:hypothetical protein